MIEMKMVREADATWSSDQIQDRAYWAKYTSHKSDGSQLDGYSSSPGVPLLKGPDDNSASLNQRLPFFLRFSTERIRGFLTAESSSDSERGSSESLTGSSDTDVMRVLYEAVFYEDTNSWPYLFDLSDNIIGFLKIRHEAIENEYIPKPGQRSGLDLICIGGLELEWNIGTGSGANSLHIECPLSDELSWKPACAKDKSLCKLGPDWKFRFYNVLWVEWKGNVAYRKGIGKIWADCWEKLEREMIEVTLG
jgi:hypothetical protein